MKGFLNNRKASSALTALCFIALGVFLLGWPELSRIWICRLLGGALLVTGIVYIIAHFVRAKGAKAVFQYDLILGIVLAILGLWLLATPTLVIVFIQYIVGAILVIHGILDLQGALNLRSGGSHWWPAILIALMTVALGALIIWNPFTSINILLMLVGFALIFDGASDLILIFQLSRTFKKVKRAAEEAAEDAAVIESEGTVEK